MKKYKLIVTPLCTIKKEIVETEDEEKNLNKQETNKIIFKNGECITFEDTINEV